MKFFLLGLVGITLNQGFYLFGLDNTSPTFASAIENSIPAITFLMSALLRIEKVNLKRKDGIAKMLGTLISIGGASIITLYKGPSIYRLNPPLEHNLDSLISFGHSYDKNWSLGCVFLVCHCLCWSCWIVLQPSILKIYPAPLSVTSFTCFFAVLQLLAIAVFMERDSYVWQIHTSPELFTVFYSGLVASGMAFTIQIWVVERGGPLFFSMYLPLQTLIVAVLASVILGETFYLGGIIGAMLIIAGLYLFLWGKSEESKFSSVSDNWTNHEIKSTDFPPLLLHKTSE